MRFRNKAMWLVPCVAMLLSGSAWGQAQEMNTQQVLEFTKPAVVFLEYFYKGWVVFQGQKYGSIKNPGEPFFESFWGTYKAGPFEEGRGASGFIVHPDGYIVTAGHCVQDYEEDGTSLLIGAYLRDYMIPAFIQKEGRAPKKEEYQKLLETFFKGGGHVSDLTKEIYIRTGNAAAYKADVLVVSESMKGKDVGIIKITGKNFPTVPIGDSDQSKEGDPIMVFGFPGIVQDIPGLNIPSLFIPTVTNGIVSAIKATKTGSPIFQLTAQTAGGNSGGPAVNARGEVVGICSFGAGETNRIGDVYGMFVPINIAKTFINQAGFSPKSGLTDEVYRRALNSYWKGDWEKALKDFKTVLELYPGHPAAEKYVLEVTEKLAKGVPSRGGFPGWLKWVLIGVLAIVVVVAIILFATRRKGAPGPVMAAPKGGGYLLGQSGPLAGNKFPIGKAGLRIGRDLATCQVVLTEDTVSREHAVIEPAAGGRAVRLRNLSATNPTYVGERPVTEAELKEGDTIRIGKATFVYKSQ